jgi:hypothetical protein
LLRRSLDLLHVSGWRNKRINGLLSRGLFGFHTRRQLRGTCFKERHALSLFALTFFALTFFF